ncbi:enoyl-CoA hydratase/isomerase family protein [Ornithinimicrobium faecis]|uniref:enoyl-CoA hydratase/isomerase family protein n=1 Tax=Ornithinimicrobium faecis TaxID=2934158 RepID=UPI002118444C|nr:enoyl-CoA hydratase/isomerase family protein [Ornithinimicrobium sp. HY1745]
MSASEGATETFVTEAAGVATLTIDRPRARNAIATSTMAELEQHLEALEDSDARVLVIRGAGDRAFISGGDLKDLASIRTHADATAMAKRMRSLLDRIASLSIPTVAALNGAALGGGAEVAVACDLRVAADDIAIGFNQSQLAIMPAWGGVERLIDLIGRGPALHLMLSGSRLSAADAKGLGLVDRVAPRDAFDAAAQEFAAALAAPPPSVSRAIKRTVNAYQPAHHDHTAATAIDEFATLWAAPEHWAAVEALRAAK